jgi:hypothetical protein
MAYISRINPLEPFAWAEQLRYGQKCADAAVRSMSPFQIEFGVKEENYVGLHSKARSTHDE